MLRVQCLLSLMMMTMAAGFVAGLIHVFSGPDHLAAIGPLALHRRSGAWRVGLRWGLGHAVGVAIVAAVSFACRGLFPLESFSSWSERLVGVVLIGIGLWGMRKALAHQVHSHQHAHGGLSHVHIHVHGPATHSHEKHTHAAFSVGALHGFAGSSHLLGVLPALAFASASSALAYLLSYGAGTILAMTTFSTGASWVALKFGGFTTHSYRLLMGSCCSFSLCLGVYWLVA